MDIRNPVVRHEFPARKCVECKCKDCGLEKYQRTIFSTNRFQLKWMSKVSWQQWGTIEYMGVDGAKKKKIGLITYTGSIAKLLSVFFEQLREISMHQFHKLWQLRNFNNTLQHLQIGQVLFVHDFQMNLMLFIQDEPAGVHWEHPQITVHPTSVFYWCLNESCNKIVREDIIHISDDKKHDKTCCEYIY